MSAALEGASVDLIEVVLCILDPRQRDATVALLRETSGFSVVAQAGNGEELVAMCREHQPDLLVMDESAGEDARRTLQRLVTERPLPALLLVSKERMSGMQRNLDIFRVAVMDRSRMLSRDNVGLSSVRTQLQLLAARGKEVKRTLPRDGLESVVEELLREDAGPNGDTPSDDVKDMASIPRDLLLVVVAPNSTSLLGGLLAQISSTRVPVVVLMDGGVENARAMGLVGARSSFPVFPLERSVHLRRLHGVSVGTLDGPISVQDELILVATRGSFVLDDTVASMQSLGSAGITFVLSRHEGSVSETSVASVVDGGGAVVRLSHRTQPSTKDLGAAALLPIHQGAWLWNHMLPRRV